MKLLIGRVSSSDSNNINMSSRNIIQISNRIVVSFLIALAMCFFLCGAQTSFAVESIPVQVLTYENGDLDSAELVWEGAYTPPAQGTVAITEAAGAFASKAPEGYAFGVAAVMNGKVDATIYQVEEIDVSNEIYRLTDYTTYNIFPGDVLAFYYYKALADLPVYWCRYRDGRTLTELSDAEYDAVVGGASRADYITVPHDRAAVLAPAKTADILTGEPDSEASKFDAYVVGRDGLLDTPLPEPSTEDDKVYYRMGGESTADSAYKIDSDGLLLQNTSSGIAFAGIGLAGLKTGTQSIDTSNPVTSPAEYEMISGSRPAVYVVYDDPSGLISLPSGAPGKGALSSMIPWIIAAALITLILILIVYLRMRRR